MHHNIRFIYPREGGKKIHIMKACYNYALLFLIYSPLSYREGGQKIHNKA